MDRRVTTILFVCVHNAGRSQMAEAFTNQPGAYVKVADTIKACKGIIEGLYDDLPEQAFYMVGTIEDALEKARKLKQGQI